MNRLLFICLLSIMVTTASTEPQIQGNPDEVSKYVKEIPKIVTIKGIGTVKIDANEAEVLLTLINVNKLLKDAITKNNKNRHEIVDLMKKNGIDMINTSKFNSTPTYGLFKNKPKNYKVITRITVVIKSDKQFENIAGLVDSIPELFYMGIKFKSALNDENKLKTIQAAIDNAMKKKEIFEESLNLKLVPIGFKNPSKLEDQSNTRFEYSKKMSYKSLSSDYEYDDKKANFDQLEFKGEVLIDFHATPKIAEK